MVRVLAGLKLQVLRLRKFSEPGNSGLLSFGRKVYLVSVVEALRDYSAVVSDNDVNRLNVEDERRDIQAKILAVWKTDAVNISGRK